MVAKAIAWPSQLIPRESMFQPESVSRSAGASLVGSEQVSVSPAARWRASFSIPLNTEVKVLAFRAMMAKLQGRAGTILVPKWENFGPKDDNGRRLAHRSGVPDQRRFNLVGFDRSDLTYATTAFAADQSSTRIAIELNDTEGPRPGQFFGVDDRLYVCQSVWRETGDAPLTVQFVPWLRAGIEAGARVILDRPVCLMRLASDLSGELTMNPSNVSEVQLDFVEAI